MTFTTEPRPDSTTPTPRLVSVIVPSLNRPDLAKRCLWFLSQQTLSPENYEVVVAENDAEPGLTQQNGLASNVRRLMLAGNYGTAGAINRGLAASSSKYVLLLNNDVELEPDFLTTLVSVLDRNDQYAFATGKLLSASDRGCLDGAGDALLQGGGAYRLGQDRKSVV